MPDTDWRIRVYYYNAGGTLLGEDISNAAFTVTINSTPTVTSPNGGESWARGSLHNVTWNVPAGNSTGYFRIWAWRPSTTANWYELTTPSGVPATGATSYSRPWTIAVPTSTDWRIRVYYYDAGGTMLGEDISNAAFTVQL